MLVHRNYILHHQDIEQGHGRGQTCMQSIPCALTRLLQPALVRQQLVSYHDGKQAEFWFQLTSDDVTEIAAGAKNTVRLWLAE
jgi:hypothetical protein